MAFKLRCPDCSEELRFRDGTETGYCGYCGRKIDFSETETETIEPVADSTLQELIRLSDEAFADGNGGSFLTVGERILELDPDNWHGYLCRANAYLYEFDLAEAYDNFSKAFSLMTEAEFMEKRSDLVNRIAACISSVGDGEDVESGNAVGMIAEAENKDVDEESTFGISVLEAVQYYCGDLKPEELSGVYLEYCEILYACILTYLDPKVSNYILHSTRIFFAGKRFNDMLKAVSDDKYRATVINETCNLFSYLGETMASRTEYSTDEEIERIQEFWTEADNPTYMHHLYKAWVLLFDDFSEDRITKKELRSGIYQEVFEFVDSFFDCRIEEIDPKETE